MLHVIMDEAVVVFNTQWHKVSILFTSQWHKTMADAVVFLHPNGTYPYPTPLFHSRYNVINPWPTPLIVHVLMAQSHGRRCSVYLLFYISRDVVSYIFSRQVSNFFLLLIESLGLINQIIAFVLTYLSCVIDVFYELQ